eukprot:3681837-Pleurochrysis_carterae.AAC.1
MCLRRRATLADATVKSPRMGLRQNRTRTLAKRQRCCQLRPVSTGAAELRTRTAAWGRPADRRWSGTHERASRRTCARLRGVNPE